MGDYVNIGQGKALHLEGGTVIINGHVNFLTTNNCRIENWGKVNFLTTNGGTHVEKNEKVVYKDRIRTVYKDRIVKQKVPMPSEQAKQEIQELRRHLQFANDKIREQDKMMLHTEELLAEKVEIKTRYLQLRIDALIEANHDAAERIKELEKQVPIRENTFAGYEPNRNDMIEMCKCKDWWIGDEVVMDDEETLRYPWIDFRDEFRHIRIEEFLEWIRERRNQSYRERRRKKE